MTDDVPTIPPEYQIYILRKLDPIYQLRFTIVWVATAALLVLVALPNLARSVRTGRVQNTLTGVRMDVNAYEPVNVGQDGASSPSRQQQFWRVFNLLSLVKACAMWTVSLLGLNVGQLVLILGYYVTVFLCSTIKSELIDNPNRPGYIAVAQLVLVFLFASKNSPLAILLSSGYEKLNFLHRWCSRCALFASVVHSLLWFRHRYADGLPIIGKMKDVTGIAAFAFLCILAITSVRPMRAHFYQIFRFIHLLTVPAFAIAMRYHTKACIPYLYPSLAFWGLDLLLRLFRFRIRRATVLAPDTQMTIIRVHDCTSGWSAGQHVRLRVFIAYRMFESHPLTILNASKASTCLSQIGIDGELVLGARVRGDWSRALNVYAHKNNRSLLEDAERDDGLSKLSRDVITSSVAVEGDEAIDPANLSFRLKSAAETELLLPEFADWSLTDHGAPIKVMLDGPYGGCAFDIGMFQSVALVAGGSGVTFTLGLLDDLVGRCLRLGRRDGEVTQRVEFSWCIRSFSALRWIAPFLTAISCATNSTSESMLDLHITVYVTRSSKAETEEDAPSIPNCDIVWERPRIWELINDFASRRILSDAESANGNASLGPDWPSLAICAAGPESLTNEVKNAAVRLALRNPRRRVDCHTEVYSL